MATRRCVIYARISVASEESVSLPRQVHAAEQYAAARQWKVVAEPFVDEGVSATYNSPENRAGWRALLESRQQYDSVIIWKIDRLARSTLDFLHANEALKERGAALVAVEDPIDMSTAQGELFATILAAFAKAEAAAIRARVKAARDQLLRDGRVPGGAIPFGWRSIPNPGGKGHVLAQDPDRIDHVREMVARTRAGRSIYSTVQKLNEAEVPLPSGSQGRRKHTGWNYSTVERLLRNPVLAGMIAHNPGNDTKQRGDSVLLGDDGLPVVEESVAIMTVTEWRAMVAQLDNRDTGQAKPRALRAQTSGMLSGLMFCGDDRHESPVRMWRGTVQGRPGYYCPECHHAISNFENVVVEEFLRQKGERVRWRVVEEIVTGGGPREEEISRAMAALQVEQNATDDDDEYDQLTAQIKHLRELRRDARDEPTAVEQVLGPANPFGEDWAKALTDEERRDILGDALHRIVVRRGRPGRRTDAQLLARLAFEWKVPQDLGPHEPPGTEEEMAAWAGEDGPRLRTDRA